MKLAAVIGGVALAALASLPARAADMTPIAPRATSGYIPAQFLWTGFYLGAGIGYGWGTSTFIDFNGFTASPSPKGFLVGGVMGINYQINSVVLGVEGDFTGSWANGSAVASTDTVETRIFWTGSITGRLGWAFDRLLIYGKGGVGFDYDRDTVTPPSNAASIGSVYRVAWTVGGGVEYAVTEHWTARVEYDYFRFPVKGIFFGGPANQNGNIGIKLNEAKLIMAYKF
jgi:outer membrane immunogenic protein